MADAAFNPSSVSYRQLQAKCKELGLPAKGKSSVLRKNLEDYLKDPVATVEKLRPQKKTKKKREGFVNWKKHAAREILMEDIEPNGWLYDGDIDARLVYEIYKETQEEFEDITFDQFEERYTAAIKQAKARRARSAQEEEWLKHDRQLHPRQTHNHRGEPVFDVDETAKEQLRKDIDNKLHKTMGPMALRDHRVIYQKCELHIFRPRIYQEIRRMKLINYLEKKRTKKRDAHKAAKTVTVVRN